MGIGAPEIIVIALVILVLFGYKKLPDASRSIGRSMRIFKGEMKGMKGDDLSTKDVAATTPARPDVVPPAAPVPGDPGGQLSVEAAEAEASAAEARAAALRARAEQARVTDGLA